MKREIGDYIEDILEAMTNAIEFTKDMSYEKFVKDTNICSYQGHRDYWRSSKKYTRRHKKEISRYSLEKYGWNER